MTNDHHIEKLKAMNDELLAQLAGTKRQRDKLLLEADDFQCQIASALGWDTGGVPMAELVRGYVLALDVVQRDLKRAQECLAVAREEQERMRACLDRIGSMAGNPDPAEACRLILREAKACTA